MGIPQDRITRPVAPRVSQIETKIATSSVTFNLEKRPRALLRHHTQFEERDHGPHLEFESNPKGEASGPSFSPIITTRIVFYEDSHLQWIQLSTKISHVPNPPISTVAVTNDSGYPDMPILTIKRTIQAVIKGFQQENHADMRTQDQRHQLHQVIYIPRNPPRKMTESDYRGPDQSSCKRRNTPLNSTITLKI